MDDSKLRLRRTNMATAPLACEEGTAGIRNPSSTKGDVGFQRSKSFDSRHTLMNLISPSSSHGSRIKGRVKRRRRRAIVGRWCKLCLGGLTAAIVSTTLSVSLLPFSWTQVDYHHQFQHEVQYVYQKLHDNRQNYHSVVDNYHPDGMSPMHNHNNNNIGKQQQQPKDPNNAALEVGPLDERRNLRRPKGLSEIEDHETNRHDPTPNNNGLLGWASPNKVTTAPKPEIVTCEDGTVGFKNDDYCDCPLDGSDEPDTSACSGILVQKRRFVCGRRKDAGTDDAPVWIYASRVNDGIIDCPDGSDEYGHVMEELEEKEEKEKKKHNNESNGAGDHHRSRRKHHHHDDDDRWAFRAGGATG